MNEAIDYSTLRWVKQELDETLTQARQALEAHVETPTDQAQMSFCAAHLHQVYGTLQMVELYGASLLAEEMEQVAKALLDDGIRQREDAYDVLMRAMLQLPDYLERLMEGGRDIPLVLLPLLNDLRAVRGESLLSENAMFSPDLSRALPAGVHGDAGGDLQALAKSLRHQYQVGLLSWYRDQGGDTGLAAIGEVLEQLQRHSDSDATARLWWLAGGLVHALRQGLLEVSLSTKLLMGQIDRQLKRLIDGGAEVFAAALPEDLQKNLLFYLARSAEGDDRIRAIKDTYDLDALLPDSSEMLAAEESLSGHNLDLIHTVSVAIKENLGRIKDGLDLFQRGGNSQPEALVPVAETLKSLGDTLGMLGMGAPRKAVLEKAQLTRDMIEGSSEPSESNLMDIAGTLLFVENALDGMAGGRRTEAATPEDAEFDQVMVVVLQEAITDLARAKDAITQFMEEREHGLLKEVPQLFNQVKGGLLLLGREKAAALVDSVGRYVAKDLLERRAVPEGETLDTLADAVCGIEYYLEGQKEKRLFGGSVIDVAVQAVERLGYPLPAELLQAAAEQDRPVAPARVAEAPALEIQGENDSLDDEPGFETLELDDLSKDEDNQYGIEEIALEAPVVEEIIESPAPVDAVEPAGVVISAQFGAREDAAEAQALPVIGEDVDEEILEIFIEEAEEEVSTIRELLPRWLADQEDQEALVTVRRSFHTLKGSGRLVGASVIGEFAWAFENLLNRVLDGTRPFHPDMGEVLEQAMQVLPLLVEQVKGGAAPELDIEVLKAHADALSRGETFAAASPVEAVQEENETGAEEPVEAMPVSEPETAEGASVMDPVLYEIFYSETDTHLKAMRCYVQDCRAAGVGCGVTEELIRALHTLHGSARMAEAAPIAEIASALEHYAKALLAVQLRMGEAGLEVLADSADVVELILALLKHEAPELPDTGPLLERIAALPVDAGEAVGEPLDLTEMGFQAPAGDETETLPDAGGIMVEEDSVDPEILEVFSEEAQEELASIQDCLPRWLERPEDQEALTTLRRSFHTLKGSGRLVGATVIGEFAWSIENLLNRVIDGTVAVSEPLQALLREAGAALAELVQQIQDGSEPAADVSALEARAHALAEGKLPGPVAEEIQVEEAPAQEVDSALEEQAEVIEPEASGEPEAESRETELMVEEVAEAPAETAVEPASAEDPYAEVDPELLEIFLEEADEILHHSEDTLQRWLESPEDGALMAEYQRHLHTLKGGARMADIRAIGDLSHGVETMLTAVVDGQAPVSKRMFDLLQLAQDRLATMVEEVHGHRLPEPAPGLIEELESLLHDTGETEEMQQVQLQPHPEEAVAEQVVETETAADAYAEADPELLEIFLEEGAEILQASEGTLHRWSQAPENFDLMAQLQRELHTLKGGARMANITAIGDLAHGVEALVTVYSDTRKIPPKAVFDALAVAQDRLVSMLEHVHRREPIASAAGLVGELRALIPGAASAAAAALEEDTTEALPAGSERRTSARQQQELVRVRADLLDNLVNYAGEISIYRARLEQQVGAYRFNLAEMEQTIVRLRQQLRQLEIETEAQILSGYQDEMDQYGVDFDPLEMDRYSTLQQLSRSLAESVGDLSSIQALLDSVTRESETLLLQQSRVNTELQEGLMRTRMVPFLGLAPRMRRIVRQTCQEVGKQAELKLEGAEGEMDRTVIDRIIAPIEHMLRNAISHGIEAPEDRIAKGKPADGTILVSLSREASEVVIRIQDDGAGISLERVREKAIERGLMRPDMPLTDNEVLQFILETGFSTAQQVTQVSGRGVGMDVVNSEVKQLGGSLHIDSEEGRGTLFTIRLPFTLAINQALLVQAGEETYAIPLSSIEGIVRMRREDLVRFYGDAEARYEYAGYRYEVQHLGGLLGSSSPNLDSLPRRVPVLLARSGEHCVALHVDNLFGSREIVVKSVGPQISTVPGVSGATILGDGSVVLILELAPLVRMGSLASLLHGGEAEPVEAEPVAEDDRVTIMVVDDSITVRKVTTRLLERNGMDVVAAKDGVDALAKLQEQLPDLMLLDIEMPRMDGFEVATHVRNDARLRDIPIIMITSRTGDKHRNRAMEIGVNRYLGKPFVEGDLLENIEQLLAQRTGHG